VHAPEQGHNHNIDCFTLNYPCPINQQRIASHNRTKCRGNGIHEQNFFHAHAAQSALLHPGWGPEPPQGPRDTSSTFFNINGGHSLISVSTCQGGPPSMFSSVDDGCSRIFNSGTHYGGRRRHFIALMVGAPRCPAPAPTRLGRRQRFLALMVDAPGSPALAPPKGPP
jgi:hypothetical protein